MCSEPETEDLQRAACLASIRRRVREAIERDRLIDFLEAPPLAPVDLDRWLDPEPQSAAAGLGT